MKLPFHVKALKSLSARPGWMIGNKATHRYLDYFLSNNQTDLNILKKGVPQGYIEQLATELYDQNASLGSPVKVPSTSTGLTFKELLLIERQLLEYQVHHSGPKTDVAYVKTIQADPNHLPEALDKALDSAIYGFTLTIVVIMLTLILVGIFQWGLQVPRTRELFYGIHAIFTYGVIGLILMCISRICYSKEYVYRRVRAISDIQTVSDTWDQVFQCKTFMDASLLSMIADNLYLEDTVYMRWADLTPQEALTFCLSLSGFGLILNVEDVAEHHLGINDTTKPSSANSE